MGGATARRNRLGSGRDQRSPCLLQYVGVVAEQGRMSGRGPASGQRLQCGGADSPALVGGGAVAEQGRDLGVGQPAVLILELRPLVER